MKDDLINYFNQVLGIQQVFKSESLAVDESVSAESLRLIEQQRKISVLFIDETPWDSQTAELFQKMCQAMKLAPEQVQVLFLDGALAQADLQLKALSATAVVNFSKESLEGISPELQFQTISPARLIKTPALKKEVWAVLQKVMQVLSGA